MRDPLSWAPKPLRQALLWLLVALVVGYVVVPRLVGSRPSWELITAVDPALFVIGVALQATAVLAQVQLTRLVIPGPHRLGLADMTRVELSTMAVSHTVPGGTAAGTALGYRLLTRAGVPGADAGFAVGVRGLGSALVLNVLLWLALVASIPTQGFRPVYTAAAVLGALLVAGFGLLVFALVAHEDRSAGFVRRVVSHLPLLDGDKACEVVERLAERVRELGGRRRDLAIVVAWSAGYWLGQAGALWVLLAAFDHRASPVLLFVAFGLANVLAVVPVTPRGLGVVEATLIPLLVAFGATRGAATLGVLAWRLVGFWLPIPLGGLAYLTLRAVPAATGGEDREPGWWEERLRGLGEEALAVSKGVREWAAEHGLRGGTARRD